MKKLIQILFVSDDEDISQKIKRIVLNTKNILHWDLARSAKDGLTKIQKGNYDVIVTGLVLPKNGLQFLRQVKLLNPDTQVILVNNCANLDNVMEAWENGAYGYIAGPFLKDDFLTILRRAVYYKSTVWIDCSWASF